MVSNCSQSVLKNISSKGLVNKMKKLFRFELHKLFRMKSLYICMAVIAGIMFISALAINVVSGLPGNELKAAGLTVSGTSNDAELNSIYFLTSAISGCNIGIFLAITVALFVCLDYTSGAMKTIVAKGFSRTKIFIAKYIVALIIGILFSIIAMLTGFGFGGVFFSFTGNGNMSIIINLLLQTLTVLADTSAYFFLAICFKKLGASIAIGVIAPSVISLLLNLIDLLIGSEDFRASAYWTSTCLSSLLNVSVMPETMIRCAVISIVWMSVFGVLSFAMSQKVEV